MQQRPYPQSKRTDVAEMLHGVRVEDPYRWLEDADSPETRKWIEEQNRVTESFLSATPARQRLRERLTQLWDYERFGLPIKEGGRYFFTRNDGLQNQSVLYVAESLDGPARELLDPNELSADGTVALSGWTPRPDGKFLAYGLSTGGSDWQTWRVRNVDTGRDADDLVEWVKFSSASWTMDGTGFFYSRYDAPPKDSKLVAVNKFQKLYFHRLGTPQSDDVLVYERQDQEEWGFEGLATEDGKFLVIHVWRGTDTKNAVFVKELSDSEAPVVELLPQFDASYHYIGNVGRRFWFKTDHSAPRGRTIAIDLDQPQAERWAEIVGQQEDTLVDVSFVGGVLLCKYLKDAQSRVALHELDGKAAGVVDLPGVGTVYGFAGKPDDPESFFQFTSFVHPGTIHRYDVRTGQRSVFRQPKVAFQPDDFITRQVFVTSKDGTKLPLFLTHKKHSVPDGRRPTYLYGYGGFNISIQPSFSVANLAWVEMGGVLAVAVLRGGGEYGETWHQAGMKHKKQNVFDDLVACAEWLTHNRYTCREKLALGGGSNGGLLVGAVITQRPDLCAAALPDVGVFDMLRYHKFTIGWAWATEYGTADDPADFAYLLRYSPLHNVRRGTAYPAVLLTTADHDDRVVPAHSFKFTAALQWAQSGHAPVLTRIETRAGHGAGKPTTKLIEQAADRWAFLVRVLGIQLVERAP